MVRLSEQLRTELIDLLCNGVSIKKVSRSTRIAKSTIYYHYRKLYGKKYQEPEFTPGASELEGEIVGIFTGDGSQYHDRKRWAYEVNVHFGGHNLAYAQYARNLFETFFNKKFRLAREKSGVFRLRIRSKKIFSYFSTYIDYLPQRKHVTVHLKTLEIPSAFKIGFLRGLFDTDGSILATSDRKSIRVIFYTTSTALAQDVLYLLGELNFRVGYFVTKRPERGFKDLYTVYLWKQSVDSFLNIIKPHKGRILGR